MDKDWTLRLITIIVILLIVIWIILDDNQQLQAENRRLVDRQTIIDRTIIEGLHSIYDAFPRPVNYVEGVEP